MGVITFSTLCSRFARFPKKFSGTRHSLLQFVKYIWSVQGAKTLHKFCSFCQTWADTWYCHLIMEQSVLKWPRFPCKRKKKENGYLSLQGCQLNSMGCSKWHVIIMQKRMLFKDWWRFTTEMTQFVFGCLKLSSYMQMMHFRDNLDYHIFCTFLHLYLHIKPT